jgi:hypothetical protein
VSDVKMDVKLRSCGVEGCRKKREEEMDYCKGAKTKF